jgi:hypothetical protein
LGWSPGTGFGIGLKCQQPAHLIRLSHCCSHLALHLIRIAFNECEGRRISKNIGFSSLRPRPG